ncbi:MAG: hypothetical protein BECKG1743D_GA0114223_109992 [Candidatus Kentron sp. G]|nr:MAG: hypothetical protein BECKG1743F_GA0114225_112892 [Candidatus Kentron sp. G]VFN07175.1 MAG: hypothetical protein BECKG1743D_GA0114223_109992 [Candidatus Kentron sp. G]VFN07803.1 MAG: hypothetical protein BECKG1743E_GA0114224_113032 [Candidatus Kentron sp. G]
MSILNEFLTKLGVQDDFCIQLFFFHLGLVGRRNLGAGASRNRVPKRNLGANGKNEVGS